MFDIDWEELSILYEDYIPQNVVNNIGLVHQNEGTFLISYFFSAILMNDIKLVMEILAKPNFNYINVCDINGKTGLSIAAQTGNTKIVLLLLEKGADIDVTDLQHNSPLMLAIGNGQLEVVKLLLKKGADIEIGNNVFATPLCCAISNKYYDIIDELLLFNADKDIVLDNHYSFLTYALEYNDIKLALLLVKYGASLYSPDGRHITPFEQAIKSLRMEFIDEVWHRLKEKDRDNFIILCVERNVYGLLEQYLEKATPECRRKAFNQTIEVEERNPLGKIVTTHKTAIRIAFERFRINCVKVLLTYGADIIVPSNQESKDVIYKDSLLLNGERCLLSI